MSIVVLVRNGNGEQAIKNIKRKLQRELVYRNMKMSRFYESPSERRVRQKKEAVQRMKKLRREILRNA